jgi:hypothetical protein
MSDASCAGRGQRLEPGVADREDGTAGALSFAPSHTARKNPTSLLIETAEKPIEGVSGTGGGSAPGGHHA